MQFIEILVSINLVKVGFKTIQPEVASGVIFHFGLNQKIPGDLKSQEWGSQIRSPQKSHLIFDTDRKR